MRCEDDELLMLAHRALDPRRTFAVRLHVLVCPACRARLLRFEALSASLAEAFPNPSLGVRTFGRTPPKRVWLPLGLLAALLILIGGLATTRLPASAPKAVAPSPAARCTCHDGKDGWRQCPVHRPRPAPR